jgi:hypothetical protein
MAHPAAGSDLALIAVTFALALAAAPSPAGSAGACTLLNLAACPDAGALVRDEGFRTALKAFVGQRRTGYITPNGQAYGETLAALSGPAEPVRRLRNLYVFTACADASCEDQGAVVLQPDGELAAAAIMHTDCNSTRRTSDCVDRQVLSILRRQNDDFSVIDNLSDWARRSLADQPIAPGAGIKSLDRVEVVALDGLAPETPPAAARQVQAPKPAPLQGVAPPAKAPTPALAAPPPPVVRPAPAVVRPEPVAPAPPPAAKPEPVAAPPAEIAEPGPVTSVASVTAVVQPLAPRIPIPLKVYLTLNTDIPTIVVVPPPPPPPPPKPKRHTEMWKWHWTPFD